MKLKNRFLNFLGGMSILLLSALSLNSCLNDSLEEFQTKGNVLKFELENQHNSTPKTYGPGGSGSSSSSSGGKTIASKSREALLNTTDPIVVLIFDHSTGSYVSSIKPIKRVDPSSSVQDKYNFVIEKVGTYDLLFVANPDNTLKEQLLKKDALTGKTKADIGKMLVTQTPGENNHAGEGSSHGHFLMTNFTENVTVKKDATVDLNKIKLTRAAARFDIKSLVEGLRISEITVENRFVESQLHRFTDMEMTAPTGTALKHAKKTYTTSDGIVCDKFSDCTGVIYGYENTQSDNNNMVIKIKATYQQQELKKPYEFTLTNTKIERNKLYSIVLTPKGSGNLVEDPSTGIGFDLEELDWDDNDVEAAPEIDKNYAPVFKFVQVNSNQRAYPLPDENNVKRIRVGTLGESTFKLEINTKKIQAVIDVLDSERKPATDDHVKVEYLENESTVNFNGDRKDIYKVSLKKNESTKHMIYYLNISNPLSGHIDHSVELFHRGYYAKAGENPLTWFAEFNMDKSGNYFTTSHSEKENGYFYYNQSQSLFANARTIDNSTEKYRLPYYNELFILAPYSNITLDPNSSRADVINFAEQNVTFKNSTYSSLKSDFRFPGNNIIYGLRFKEGNTTPPYKWLSAYRYEHKPNPDSEYDCGMIEIRSVLLGEAGKNITLDDISKESYWEAQENSTKSGKLCFPVSGYNTSGEIGKWGFARGNGNYGLFCHPRNITITTVSSNYHCPVRLIQHF